MWGANLSHRCRTLTTALAIIKIIMASPLPEEAQVKIAKLIKKTKINFKAPCILEELRLKDFEPT